MKQLMQSVIPLTQREHLLKKPSLPSGRLRKSQGQTDWGRKVTIDLQAGMMLMILPTTGGQWHITKTFYAQ